MHNAIAYVDISVQARLSAHLSYLHWKMLIRFPTLDPSHCFNFLVHERCAPIQWVFVSRKVVFSHSHLTNIICKVYRHAQFGRPCCLNCVVPPHSFWIHFWTWLLGLLFVTVMGITHRPCAQGSYRILRCNQANSSDFINVENQSYRRNPLF